MAKPTLVVMAAGMGSRYGGLKQIDPVGPSGEVVLDYSVFDAVRAGFGRVVFIIRRDIEDAFKERVGGHYAGHIDVDYAFQELTDLPEGYEVPEGRSKPWGTTHAVLACRDIVNEPFAVINADDFYGQESFEVLANELSDYNPEEDKACLVGFVIRNTLSDFGPVTRAVCETDDDGYLTEIVERHKIEKLNGGARYLEEDEWVVISGEEPVSMNMWGYTPALFPALQESFETFLKQSIEIPKSECLIPTTVGELIDERGLKARVLSSKEKWFGVTYPEDKPSVMEGIKQLVDAGQYPASLWG